MHDPEAQRPSAPQPPGSIRRWFRSRRGNRWVVLAGLVVAAEVCLLILFNTGLEVLSAARAYVGGESLYSKGQKDAVGYLRDFAVSHSERDYQLYLTAIAVPLGDRQARLALEKPELDTPVAFAGFRQGGNDEADLGRLVWLFRTFRQLPLFAHAVDIWARGDADVQLLSAAGSRLHDEITVGDRDSERVARSLREIAAINSDLTSLEVEFSTSLGEAARWVQSVLLLGQGLATAALLAVAGGLGARRIFRRINLSEADYRDLIDSAVEAVIAVDADGRIAVFNRAAQKVFDQTPQAVIGQPLTDLLTRADSPSGDSTSTGRTEMRRFLGRRRDGSLFDAECGISKSTLAGRSGQAYMVRDVTERTLAQAALAASESRAKRESEHLLALHHASTLLAAHTAEPDAVLDEVLRSAVTLVHGDGGSLYQWDAAAGLLRCVRNWNVPAENIVADARPGTGLSGQTFASSQPIIVNDYMAWQAGVQAGRDGGLRAGLGVPLVRQGTCFGVLLIRVYGDNPKRFDDEDSRLVSLFGDQVAAALFVAGVLDQQRHAALHDALTGLPNRSLLNQRLDQAMADGRRDGRPMALLLMDLERFKDVNDTLGHSVGDKLLQAVGRRMTGGLRPGDMVARLGGDEFGVLLPATTLDEASAQAQHLLAELERPFQLDEHQLDVGASVGIAMFPEHGEDADTLLRRADVAMYTAKRGGGGLATYRSDLDTHTLERLATVGELRRAIEAGDLLLHYQPKVDCRTGDLSGVEALVRWQHSERGLVFPDQFIPLAEQTGLIGPLSRWVVEAALKQCRAWLDEGLRIPVAVNLAMQDLHDATLPAEIDRLLALYRLPASLLRLEITESGLMADPTQALETLAALNALGMRIAIDDFGTGYSSLSYLKRLPVDELKIDRSFVHEMVNTESDRVIVRSTIDLAHNLGLRVVAEGVEDQLTMSLLARLGCDEIQGDFMSRPLPAPSLEAWLKQAATHLELKLVA